VAAHRGVEAQLVLARQQQLEAVVPGVAEARYADQLARLLGAAAGYAADQAVAAGQLGERGAGVSGDGGQLRPVDDRRQRPVDVREHRRRTRVLPQRGDQGIEARAPGGRRHPI
jgi:hypothetical protein